MRAEAACRSLILAFALCVGPQAHGQSRQAAADSILTGIRGLYESGQWEAILQLIPAEPQAPAEFDYYRGMALARLERWPEARAAFQSGWLKAPRDTRFPIELAGVMFKLGKRSESESFLKRALRLDPADTYANDFLAGLYFLDGNLEAALKYWNRAGKPLVHDVNMEPGLHIDLVLLDHALAFSPDEVLTLKEFNISRALVDSLGVFSSARFELQPADDGSFNLSFGAMERNGLGGSWAERLVSLLRGVPYQTVHPEYFNIKGTAWNSISLFRWDSQKRRLYTSLSGPAGSNPGLRFRVLLDARRENWNIASSLRSSTSWGTHFTMKTLEAGAEIQTFPGSRTRMRNGIFLSDRHFDVIPAGDPVSQALFGKGVALGYEIALDQSWSIPEHRFDLSWGVQSRAAKILASPDGPFLRTSGAVQWQWLPRAVGNDYRISGRFGAGTTAGRAPFDELFSLGMDRDNDLYLRGHNGTPEGKKGSGPLGRGYVLMNLQMDKLVHSSGLWELSIGPFFDTGRTFDDTKLFGSPWLCDAGLQSRLTVLNRFTLSLSYGRDLDGGKGAFFSRILR